MRWLLLLSGAAWLHAQQWSVPCQAPPATLRILEALPPARDYAVPFEARIAPRRALAEKYPDDLFIQRDYQDAFRRASHLAGEYDRALAMYRRRGADPMARYLEARLLMMAQPARSRATFEELMARHPNFTWPQLDMLQWSHLPGRRDTKEAERRLRAFTAVCPDAVEIAEQAALAEDAELVRSLAARLRAALESRSSPLDYAHWPILWMLEGGGEQIRSDLKRLTGLRLELLYAYRQAAEKLKDPGILEEFQTRVAREAPHSQLAVWLVESQWARRNPYPPRDASPAEHAAFQQKQRQARAEWRRRWPEHCSLIAQWWWELSTRMPGAELPPLEERLAAADGMLRCGREVPDAGMSVPPLETNLARCYVEWNTRLERVPGLLDAGMAAMERQQKYRISEELIPAEMRRGSQPDAAQAAAEVTQEIRARYLAAVNRLDEARAIVEQRLAAATGYRRNMWRRQLADVAAKQNRVDEALRLYQESLAGTPREALAKVENPYLAPVRAYYLAHGGTEAGWQDWAAAAKSDTAPPGRSAPAFREALPEFAARDLAGRVWTLANLKGKVTLVNFWATWCGPCRYEHPELQKLHERMKGRRELQVLTLSVDDDAAAVREYVREKGYTFPVIHDRQLADRLFPYAGLPTNLLVNAEARRSGLYGFGGGEAVQADMEKALIAPGGGQPSPAPQPAPGTAPGAQTTHREAPPRGRPR